MAEPPHGSAREAKSRPAAASRLQRADIATRILAIQRGAGNRAAARAVEDWDWQSHRIPVQRLILLPREVIGEGDQEEEEEEGRSTHVAATVVPRWVSEKYGDAVAQVLRGWLNDRVASRSFASWGEAAQAAARELSAAPPRRLAKRRRSPVGGTAGAPKSDAEPTGGPPLKRGRFEAHEPSGDVAEGGQGEPSGDVETTASDQGELLAWILGETPEIAAYSVRAVPGDPRVPYIRLLEKDDPQQACFDWAVRGFKDRNVSAALWQYLAGDKEFADVTAHIADDLRLEFARLRKRIIRVNSLVVRAPNVGSGLRDNVRAVVKDGVAALLKASGFELGEANDPVSVVFHYKADMGAGLPDHFWLEVTDGVTRRVIQTVAGDEQLEIGPETIRYDPVAGRGRVRRGAHDAPFTEGRVHVKALLPEQAAVLEGLREVEAEATKPKEAEATKPKRSRKRGR